MIVDIHDYSSYIGVVTQLDISSVFLLILNGQPIVKQRI